MNYTLEENGAGIRIEADDDLNVCWIDTFGVIKGRAYKSGLDKAEMMELVRVLNVVISGMKEAVV